MTKRSTAILLILAAAGMAAAEPEFSGTDTVSAGVISADIIDTSFTSGQQIAAPAGDIIRGDASLSDTTVSSIDSVNINAASADTSPINTASADTATTDTSSVIAKIKIPPPHRWTYFLHEKRTVKSIDTLITPSLTGLALSSPSSPNNNSDYGNLSISGYKSFGVSVGELGEVNLEQGLEVSIEGEIRPGVSLSAYLSDRGSSLDGSTREISDFDMMNVRLWGKGFSVTAGDLLVEWPEGGILSGRKKTVGLSGEVSPWAGRVSVNAFGAFSGGNGTVQTVRGREGVQGPYYLTGRGEAGIITPVSGTVRVRVNGRNLEEGRDRDFFVDYDIGAVTFNPRVMICADDFIRVEYEYKAFDYRRTFTGGGASYYMADSVFSMRGNLWSESDDKNHPIEMQLGPREKEILKNSGSSPAYAALTARPVHPLDVAGMSVYHPLYKKIYDGAARDTILVYTPYNPLRPNDTRDFYTAAFTPAQTGTAGADYVVDDTVDRGQLVYRYAGAGLGDHTALAPIAAPMRETAGEMEARLRLPHVSASLNIAGKEHDKNLFSDLDDENNLSSAVIFKLGAGEKRMDKRSVCMDFDYRYRSRNFTSEIFSADERKDIWDADGGGISDRPAGREFQSWESTVGGTAAKGLAVSAGGGRSFVDSLTETEKAAADTRLRFMEDKLGIDAGAVFFRHHLSDISKSLRRHAKLIVNPSQSWESFAGYGDEWRTDTAGRGGGHISGTAEAAYIPANLRQSVSAAQYRRGDALWGAADTGYALTWNQSAELTPLELWRLTGDSRWRRTKINGQGVTSTFLMSAVSEIDPTPGGFSSRQEYRLNQELSSRFEQKMFYIGKGLGTHAFDSTAGEFRPSANGDHIIQEVEVYDNASSTTVRKTTLSGDWHFRPAKKISGILGDLAWSGALSVEEHVDARNKKTVSYIPGYLSLSTLGDDGNTNDSDDSSIDYNPYYSDMSYRQDIDYHIQGSDYKTRLYFIPGLRLVRGYIEKSFETALRIERKKGKLLLSAEPKYITVSRESRRAAGSGLSSGEFDLSDIGMEFVQSREVRDIFELYIRERAGRIYDNGKDRVAPVPADSSVYVQIKPGIACRPTQGGIAELSYTFSYVPYAGQLDYRMAGGHRAGTSHIITLLGDIRMGKNFDLSALYRGDITRQPGDDSYSPMTHVFSLTVKAFL